MLLLALKNKNVKKRHPITLQHPEAKFLQPLIEKEVMGQPSPSAVRGGMGE